MNLINPSFEELDVSTNQAKAHLDNYLRQHQFRLNPAELDQIHGLQSKLEQCIFEIGAFGLASSGKTSVLNALRGQKTWQTSPLHGTTKDLDQALITLGSDSRTLIDENNSDKTQLKAQLKTPISQQIKLIDTPGFNEANSSKAEIAIKAAHQADLILFVTAGEPTSQELEIITQLQHAQKPIFLVCNKTDLYPKRDRFCWHQALQDQRLQNLISVDEIIFTCAEPLPRRVRLQYAENIQEIWESREIDIHELKQKILNLLNQDGKTLLAINILRSLDEINQNLMKRQLEQFWAPRSIAGVFFIIKAIAILILANSILATTVATGIDFGVVFGIRLALGGGNWKLGFGSSILSGIILANIQNHFGQIAWLGIYTPGLIIWILQKNSISSKLIKKLKSSSSENSILRRLEF